MVMAQYATQVTHNLASPSRSEQLGTGLALVEPHRRQGRLPFTDSLVSVQWGTAYPDYSSYYQQQSYAHWPGAPAGYGTTQPPYQEPYAPIVDTAAGSDIPPPPEEEPPGDDNGDALLTPPGQEQDTAQQARVVETQQQQQQVWRLGLFLRAGCA